MMIKRLAGGTALLVTSLSGLGTLPLSFANRGRAEAAVRIFVDVPVVVTMQGQPVAAQPSLQTLYFAGKRAGSSAERRRYYSAGIAAARARLASHPDDPDALLWLAAHLGSEALERGKLAALNVLDEMEKLLLRLEAVAPEYDHAAAARTLGRIYHKAPGFISIGSMKRARIYWDRALARAGDHPANLVLAADFFADVGERARAYALARRYLAAPVTEAENPDATEWREIAERIVKRGPK